MKKSHREYVESLMGMLEAFKRGKPVQRRGKITTNGKWETFDLAKWLDDKPLQYRAKPSK